MTKKEVFQLLQKFATPRHVVLHSQGVAKVSMDLARKIQKRGKIVNLDHVYSAAMLHDLVRVCDMRNFDPNNFPYPATSSEKERMKAVREKWHGKNHADAACEILTELGESEIGEIIRRHNFLCILDPKDAPRTLEEKIVYYADKRVSHEKIVSLSERLSEGKKRYVEAHGENLVSGEAEKRIFELEKELFDLLS